MGAEGDFTQVCAYKWAGNKYFITENAGFFDGVMSGGQHKGHCSCTNTLRAGCGGNAHEYAYNTPPSHKVCPDDLKSKFITECGKTWRWCKLIFIDDLSKTSLNRLVPDVWNRTVP